MLALRERRAEGGAYRLDRNQVIRELRAMGLSLKVIGVQFGLTRQGVHYILKRRVGKPVVA